MISKLATKGEVVIKVLTIYNQCRMTKSVLSALRFHENVDPSKEHESWNCWIMSNGESDVPFFAVLLPAENPRFRCCSRITPNASCALCRIGR